MKRYYSVIQVIILATTFFTILYAFKSKQNEQTNIVLIFTDDQGYADVGCFGAQGFETPNLDQLASDGIRFTNFYASQAVCSASRASLLTGCYAERVSIQGALMPWSVIGLNEDEITIAELLKQKNYATGAFGKWHLGHYEQFLPLQHGFDEYYGLPYSNDMWPVNYAGKLVEKKVGSRKLGYPRLPLIDGNKKIGEVMTLDDQAKLTRNYTERAVAFINKNKNKPFFLYLAHSMPHVPLGVSEKYKGKTQYGMYGDVIEEIDWSVGEILKTLKDNGLDDNTVVIFASDNGPWMNYGTHAGSAYPLREGKGTAFEGGVRVPCIVRWPGHTPENVTIEQMASTIDILPTIAEITGTKLPDHKIDGVSIVSLLENRENVNPRNEFYYYYGAELRAVRQGEWKLILPHKSRSYKGLKVGKKGFPGKTKNINVELGLYNLDVDIGEQNNVAEQFPEIVRELQQLVDLQRIELGDRITGITGKGVRPSGVFGPQRNDIQHLAISQKISYNTEYSTKYTGGGNQALIDGKMGSVNFGDGKWQAYSGKDMDVMIDLGKLEPIRQIRCSFLKQQQSWIFLPLQVDIFISSDGKSFEMLKSFQFDTQTQNLLPEIKEVNIEIPAKETRYIKIKAKNIGKCPDWHSGAGSNAWLFVDEIVVN
ncbi:MAG: arylsulfatase [Bacteroidetes bacterium]|nr:MAG: arylsulfatase [Bacteroidota bacterium]